MGRVMMYITLILTIAVLAPYFGVATFSLMILGVVENLVLEGGGFIFSSFTDGSLWTTITALLAISIGGIFIGTAFKIPMELIALIPLAILFVGFAGDLFVINTHIGQLCVDTTSQFGCFMKPMVNLLSLVLFVGYIFTLISWWAGRNA